MIQPIILLVWLNWQVIMLVVYGHKFNWWKTIAKQNTHAGQVAQDRCLNDCSHPTGPRRLWQYVLDQHIWSSLRLVVLKSHCPILESDNCDTSIDIRSVTFLSKDHLSCSLSMHSVASTSRRDELNLTKSVRLCAEVPRTILICNDTCISFWKAYN